MTTIHPPIILALCLLLVGCSRETPTPNAQQTAALSAPSTFAEVIKHTPLVAEVTVLSMVGRDDVTGTSRQPVIVTDLTLRLERRLGKTTAEQLLVTMLGGAIGERGMQVSDQPVLAKGERYIVFADPGQKQRPFPVGPASVLHVVDGQVYGLDGRAVLAVRAEGFVFGRKAGVPELTPPSLVEPAPRPMTDVEVMTALEGFAQ